MTVQIWQPTFQASTHVLPTQSGQHPPEAGVPRDSLHHPDHPALPSISFAPAVQRVSQMATTAAEEMSDKVGDLIAVDSDR